MHYLTHPTATLTQSNNTVYKFRPNAWTFVLVYQCLVMALPMLKLLHISAVSEWSWLWITLPVWAPSALLAVVLGVEQVTRLGKANNQVHSLVGESTPVSC
jgi:hypothetical protein